MKQELLNELNAIEGDIVFINCTNMGTVPHIIRGPRFNVPLKKTQVASLITMGYKIEIVPTKKEVVIAQETKEVLVEEKKVTEIVQEIPEETKVVVVETNPQEISVQLEKTKEEEVVEDNSADNSLDGMSKTKLKKLLKEHNIEFENSDSIEVLKEKASAII